MTGKKDEEPQNKNSENISEARAFLKARLRRDHTNLYGFETEQKDIYDLLKRTGEIGESNSLLLIGPQGSGKRTLINGTLHKLMSDKSFFNNTITVVLDGMMHTDDRLALKSITVQMKLENAVDGKVFGSFAENLSFLLASLKSGTKKSKSVLFIIYEFDLFCAHHNQTLLYNLFDISQSAQAPICVLGVTRRLDVIELLEKRVKSRFSHRQIFLHPKEDDVDEKMSRFKELLTLPNEKEREKSYSEKLDTKHIQFTELYFLRNMFDPSLYKYSDEFCKAWNKKISALSKNENIYASLEKLNYYNTSESSFKTFLFYVVSRISEKNPEITPELVNQIISTFYNDDKINILCGLSVLEISLMISIKHHSEIYDRDPFNFEIIFTRFSKFAKISSTMQGIERPVVLKAFEHLKKLEIILPVSSITGKVQKEFQMHKLALTFDQIKTAIKKYPNLPTEIGQWAQSSLV
ncbi:ORC4 family protein [Megaselia abdita]